MDDEVEVSTFVLIVGAVLLLAGVAIWLLLAADGDGDVAGDVWELSTEGSDAMELAWARGEELRRTVPLVEELRQLEFRDPPRPRYVGRTVIEQLTAGHEQVDYDTWASAAARGAAYELLGVFDHVDVESLSDEDAELDEVPALGVYDPDRRRLYVYEQSEGTTPSVLERATLAHEIAHALVDEAVGLPEFTELERADAQVAARALAEGDASLVEERYAAELGETVPSLLDDEDPEEVPWMMLIEAAFPYEQGREFVRALERRGGWSAVDAAYADLPASTAEVLEPSHYGTDFEPVDPADPRRPAGWFTVGEDDFGAVHVLGLLSAPAGDPSLAVSEAEPLASTWTGGELHAFTDGADAAVLVTVVSEEGALCDALEAWHTAAWPGENQTAGAGERLAGPGRQDRWTVLRCTDTEARLALAPSLEVARALAG